MRTSRAVGLSGLVTGVLQVSADGLHFEAATPACVAASLDDRISLAAQIAADLLPKRRDLETARAELGL